MDTETDIINGKLFSPKKEIPYLAASQRELKDIIQNKISHTKEVKYFIISLTCES